MRGSDIPEFLRMDWGWLLATAVSLALFSPMLSPHLHLAWVFLWVWSLLQAGWFKTHWDSSVVVFLLTASILAFGARSIAAPPAFGTGWWIFTVLGFGFDVAASYVFCGEIAEAFDDGVSPQPDMTPLFAALVPVYYFQYKFREFHEADMRRASAMPASA